MMTAENLMHFLEHIRIVDTETTGTDTDVCEMIEFAIGLYSDSHEEPWVMSGVELIKPASPIPPEASATNNISNRMVADKPTIAEAAARIENLLDLHKEPVFVAHHAAFDMKVMANSLKPYVKPEVYHYILDTKNWICTFRLARHILAIDPSDQMKYNLAFLRYFLDLDLPDDLVAHRAEADVKTCGALLLNLLEKGIESGKLDVNVDFVEQLVDLSQQPITVNVFPFGKHKGMKLADVPTDYYSWALKNMDSLQEGNPRYDSDLAASIVKVLEVRLA